MLDLLPAEERDDRQLVTITRNLGHLLNADGFAVACEAIEKNVYQPRLEGSRAAYALRVPETQFAAFHAASQSPERSG